VLPVLLLLSLTTCIPVEDFGAFWDRTDLDQRLKGKWKQIAASPDQTREHGYGIGNISELVERDGAFELLHISTSSAGEDGPTWPVKTLTTGRHQWIVLGRRNAVLAGYQVDGRYLHICPGGDTLMAAFIRTRYPNASNIDTSLGVGPPVGIKLFDATAFAILRDYPGADHCIEETFTKYERVP
jgi:hypothetical protein